MISDIGYIAAVDSVNPTVFVINPEDGNLVKWFDCSQHMKEPSDIAVSLHEFYICDFKVSCYNTLFTFSLLIDRILFCGRAWQPCRQAVT